MGNKGRVRQTRVRAHASKEGVWAARMNYNQQQDLGMGCQGGIWVKELEHRQQGGREWAWGNHGHQGRDMGKKDGI